MYERRANGLWCLLGRRSDGTWIPFSFLSLAYAERNWKGVKLLDGSSLKAWEASPGFASLFLRASVVAALICLESAWMP